MTSFWNASLDQTVLNSERIAGRSASTRDIGQWLKAYSDDVPTSSAQGVSNLPFQQWFHFKEAFSPKFVADTIGSVPYDVNRCIDPFAGSGTTALTCRMLNISSTVVEVNPFLADLVEAKLVELSPAGFYDSYEKLISKLSVKSVDRILPPGMPPTFCEPGVGGRYVFSEDVFSTARAVLRVSHAWPTAEARLLRVLLGSVLVSNSNVVVNGKGRRYRRNWEERQKTGRDLLASLDIAVDRAVSDLTQYSGRYHGSHTVLRGDARQELANAAAADLAIFSPPYPNSFDYTDVYNLELWMLGYLSSSPDNHDLRHKTLRSHVQTKWSESKRTAVSCKLTKTLQALEERRSELWNRNIPEMVGYYFEDLLSIFRQLYRILPEKHHAVVAIGDSQYGGVLVDVAKILSECLASEGFYLAQSGEIRSMRSSAQHGGNFDLSEHCLVFEKF